jgi:hypothetical protein
VARDLAATRLRVIVGFDIASRDETPFPSKTDTSLVAGHCCFSASSDRPGPA